MKQHENHHYQFAIGGVLLILALLFAGEIFISRGASGDGTVESFIKVAHNLNGGPTLADNDEFGSDIATLGDLDGDGVADIAVGARSDDTGGTDRGAVHVLFMNADGTVKSSTKIAHNLNGGPSLVDGDAFGGGVAALGDLDGDTVSDMAVGAFLDNTGGAGESDVGAVYVLLMNADGTVKSSTKIAHNLNGGPSLAFGDLFGARVSSNYDLDNDGINDLAVGAPFDDTGGNARGALHVLFMNADGTVKSSVKIAHNLNGGPSLADDDAFGDQAAFIGDVDGDTIPDIAAGRRRDDTLGTNKGAVYILFMNADGTVRTYTKISHNLNGGPSLADNTFFGATVSRLGDFDEDGIPDLIAGSNVDDTGCTDCGAFYVFLLNADGTAKSYTKIAHELNGGPTLVDGDRLGSSVEPLGDLDGDGVIDVVAGARGDDTGGSGRGAFYTLFMRPQFRIDSIVPNAGENNADTVVTIIGSGFRPTSQVWLSKFFEANINCTGFTFINHTELRDGTCETTGAPTGSWNLEINNPDPPQQAIAKFSFFTISVAESSNLTQQDYRWYENIASTSPGVALVGENTAITEVSNGDIIRLRINAVASTTVSPGGALRLEYREGPTGSWNPVGAPGSGALWRGYDNQLVSDGELIYGWGPNGTGIVTNYSEFSDFKTSAVDSLNRLYVAGGAYINGKYIWLIARYLPSGFIDTTWGPNGDGIIKFDPGGTTSQMAFSLVLDSQERVYVGGGYFGNTGSGTSTILRYSAAGVLDSSWGTSGAVTYFDQYDQNYSNSRPMVIDDSDNIYVGGTQNNPGGPGKINWVVRKFDSSGVPVNSWGVNGTSTYNLFDVNSSNNSSYLKSLGIDNQGRVYSGGQVEPALSGPRYWLILKYTSTGGLDGAWGVGGKATSTVFSIGGYMGLALDESRNLFAHGSYIQSGNNHESIGLKKFNSAGVLDGTFAGGSGLLVQATNGHFASDFSSQTLRFDEVGNIIAAYQTQQGAWVINKYFPNGTLDASWASNGAILGLGCCNGGTPPIVISNTGGLIVPNGSSWRIQGYDEAGFLLGRTGKVLSSSNSGQTYEENGMAVIEYNVPAGTRTEWDFVIQNNSTTFNTPYSFRLAASDGTPLGGYNNYAELTTAGEPPPGNLPPNAPTLDAPQGGTSLKAIEGVEVIRIDNIDYTRWFEVLNVSRGVNDNIESAYDPLNDDPSTQKIITRVTWNGGDGLTFVNILTRHVARIFRQTDWSAGVGAGNFTERGANNWYSSSEGLNATSTPGSVRVEGY